MYNTIFITQELIISVISIDMIPTFLITFREVIEASLIVATILGILKKLNQRQHIKTVWRATLCAFVFSIGLLVFASLVGVKIQTIYTGKIEEIVEGSLMIVSAIFITWAVFFLHNYFSRYKLHLLTKIKETVERKEQKGLFILVFTAVFREGFEIVLFLSTIYFSSTPQTILTGFSSGLVGGLLVSLALFSATVRMSVRASFKTTSVLLILFAAGLLARGVHEFGEIGLVPQVQSLTFLFIPSRGSFAGDIIQTIFGISRSMNFVQLGLYGLYVVVMGWYVSKKKNQQHSHV